MAHYGNILTLVDSDEINKNNVETILLDEQVSYFIFNELFFIETTSKLNTKNVLEKLNQLTIEYLFYHNHISDGSKIKSKNIDSEITKQIKKILLQ